LDQSRSDSSRRLYYQKGGTLIEYTDEDPEIRRAYRAELANKGIEPDMNYAAAANDD
jgi:hypothetical protein